MNPADLASPLAQNVDEGLAIERQQRLPAQFGLSNFVGYG